MPVTSAPIAVTIPVRQAAAAAAEAGRMRPARVSVSSLVGWMTRYSSSGSSETSRRCGSCTMCKRYPGDLHPSRGHDPLEELLRPLLARRAEDGLRRPLLEDLARVEEANPMRHVARERHL